MEGNICETILGNAAALRVFRCIKAVIRTNYVDPTVVETVNDLLVDYNRYTIMSQLLKICFSIFA